MDRKKTSTSTKLVKCLRLRVSNFYFE